MNNFLQNYEIILNHFELTGIDIESFTQIRTPKLGNLELVALNLTAEYMSINTELQLFKCLKISYLEHKIERSIYNKRRRKLFDCTETIRKRLSEKFVQFTDVFVIDSMPTPICKYTKTGRSKLCSTYNIQPTFGRCASQKSKYFGYKLHAVCDKNGVFHSFDLAPAHIYDVNYLKDVKHNLKNCTLIGDKGYISADYQLDLFTHSNINLSIPMRKNQHDFIPFSKLKGKIRNRIETNFSQIHGQFLWSINHAKSFMGLAIRILSKITTFSMIQYLNVFVFNRPINKIKTNLT
jgi:hypothetical protein